MNSVGRGWSWEKPRVSPGDGNTVPPGPFPASPTLIFYFLFQKAKQKQKQVSQGRDWGLGGSWLLAVGTGFWAVIVGGARKHRGEGAQNF